MSSRSFLPPAFAPQFAIDEAYAKSVAYFSMEYAIDPSFKIYSGGLGFLAGSHMRSAAALRQNLVGIGIHWTCGYYNQTRGDGGEMAVQYRRKHPAFLKETGVEFVLRLFDQDVWLRALYLAPEIFGTVPMFFLTSDDDRNSAFARSFTQRLYDQDHQVRIAQYLILGRGGAILLEQLGVEPDLYHLNEAHGISAGLRLFERYGAIEQVRERVVFTTHTPEDAGNEKTDLPLLQRAGFFGNLPQESIQALLDPQQNYLFNHSLAALRLSRRANAVSALHGEVSRHMWASSSGICPITHITNAQNKKFWVDPALEQARQLRDVSMLRQRKRELKEQLCRTVMDQTGKLMSPDVLTIVWARRFAGYKRADLIAQDKKALRDLLNQNNQPVQLLWAGKPYPSDYAAIDTFNSLTAFTSPYPNAAVLVGYELDLSRQLKQGSDIWLNTPIIGREASGTSGMAAAMNASLSLTTQDGWICEFGKHLSNSFLIPPAAPELTPQQRDDQDRLAMFEQLHHQILPTYYQQPDTWSQLCFQAMDDIAPQFDSDRMAAEYYTVLYS